MVLITKEDVGVKFKTDAGDIFEVVMYGSENLVVKGCTGKLYVIDFDLVIDKRKVANGFRLVKRCIDVWWLKHLPDADFFIFDWLSYDEGDGCWYNSEKTPVILADEFDIHGKNSSLHAIKMPELKGDEWKKSKISIAELRAWQSEYKL